MTFHKLNVCHATSPVLILTFKPFWNFIFTHEISRAPLSRIYYFYIYKRENKECRVVYLWVLLEVLSVIGAFVSTFVISYIYIGDTSYQR